VVKCKLEHEATPKDLNVSPLSPRTRCYFHGTCASLFVLSAEHGLVHPEDVLDPYERTLSRVNLERPASRSYG
jgi:hypothetical protein